MNFLSFRRFRGCGLDCLVREDGFESVEVWVLRLRKVLEEVLKINNTGKEMKHNK